VDSISRRQVALYAAGALLILLLGARYLRDSRPASGGAGGRAVPVRVDAAGEGWVVVQVAGEVRDPGVYRLRAGQRVDDAVRRAGGPTGRADLAGVNLAAKAEDGRQVIVPARAPPAGAAGAAAPSTAGASAGVAPGQPLNLNTATVDQLDELDGIGPQTAEKIVAYREQHGGFRSVSELDRVPGIGEKRLAALQDLVRV